ncbi:outer membrane protein [Tardiphaga sp. 172_B4_N1_3]|uniref:outer membrane protein n=1 Tax=Tardiphaga sp. 172_B4_N1_3 TaxID=3240787 RepID=UPI003F88FEA9
MKKLLIAAFAVAAVATGSPASAADLAARPYTKAPALAPVYNWTGFYIGGNAGYSWGKSRTDTTFVNTATGAVIVPPAGSITSGNFSMDGAIAGGQIGYNWQTPGSNWVWGLEADAQWSDERGGSAYRCANTLIGGACLPGLTFLPPGATGTNIAVDQSLEWFGTVRGRVGVLASPTVLLYGTGGLAYGSIKSSAAITGFTPAGVAVVSAGSASDVRIGWTVGAGVEAVISGPWTAKLEYLYMDLGSYSSSYSLAPASTVRADVNSSFTDHILRAGINYRF